MQQEGWRTAARSSVRQPAGPHAVRSPQRHPGWAPPAQNMVALDTSCHLHRTQAAQTCLAGKISNHAHHTSASKLGSSVSVSCVPMSCVAGATAASLPFVARRRRCGSVGGGSEPLSSVCVAPKEASCSSVSGSSAELICWPLCWRPTTAAGVYGFGT